MIVTSNRDQQKIAPQIREEINMARSKPITLTTVKRYWSDRLCICKNTSLSKEQGEEI